MKLKFNMAKLSQNVQQDNNLDDPEDGMQQRFHWPQELYYQVAASTGRTLEDHNFSEPDAPQGVDDYGPLDPPSTKDRLGQLELQVSEILASQNNIIQR